MKPIITEIRKVSLGMSEGYVLVHDGRRYLLDWILECNFSKYSPIVQVYGIIYDDQKNILIGTKSLGKPWALMGGKPEGGETYLETLEREMLEEADITFKNPILLGVQSAIEIDLEGSKIGEPFYQARVVAEVDKVLDQTPDPDTGEIWVRKFVPIDEAEDILGWGSTAAKMFKDARKIIGVLK